MAQSIILKRSAQEGKSPDTASLNLGELAINTYDGKVFLKKSGSIESIQSLVTTDSLTTGSISLTGDLTVLGTVNARQFNISVISSSVIYQSGSTKFGDTSDDTHSFTGSVSITGSVSASIFIGVGNLTDFSSSLDARINSVSSSAGGGGGNTFDFNLEPSVGEVGFIEDSTGNTQVIPQSSSIEFKIASISNLSISSTTMNVTTGSITANYMHLAKYINNDGDLDFNV
jgi:hypothetical protein